MVSFNPNALSVNAIFTDPPIDSASVVPDLEPLSLNCLYYVQILKSIHLAQNNISHFQIFGFHWNHRDCGPWTVDCRPWTVDCGLWAADKNARDSRAHPAPNYKLEKPSIKP